VAGRVNRHRGGSARARGPRLRRCRRRSRAPRGTTQSGRENKVKAIEVFKQGEAAPSAALAAGGVAKIWGLSDGRIGDQIGEGGSSRAEYQFPPPTLASVIGPSNIAERGRLLDALAQLAEQDPLINVRQDDARHEISVSLYGEVQQEVIAATLATDYGDRGRLPRSDHHLR
jgi:ribosomal protection tetracycline resistance protein